MKTVFVDSSAFLAVLEGDDPFHEDAVAAFRRAGREAWRLLTTSYVVHEAWALIQHRLGWEAMDAFLGRLLPRCEVFWVDHHLHTRGAARCRQARNRRLSLTDCVSFEYMRQEDIIEAIARDSHFQREGFSWPGMDTKKDDS